MKYAGRLVAIITEEMLDANWRKQSSAMRLFCSRVRGAIGKIWPQDVGKRVFDVDGVIQVENDEQRDARLNRLYDDVIKLLRDTAKREGVK